MPDELPIPPHILRRLTAPRGLPHRRPGDERTATAIADAQAARLLELALRQTGQRNSQRRSRFAAGSNAAGER